jgi:hypothetical protein
MKTTRRVQSVEATLRRWAREVALPLIQEEHRVTHDSFKEYSRPRAHSPMCKPYLDAIAAYRKAVRR